VDPERLQLAQKQFRFYSEELAFANPFSADSEAPTVELARRYLKQFNADERIYQALLDAASKQNPSVNFNRLFRTRRFRTPRSARRLYRQGMGIHADGLRQARHAVQRRGVGAGPADLRQPRPSRAGAKAARLLHADFIQEWRDYLRQAG